MSGNGKQDKLRYAIKAIAVVDKRAVLIIN